MKKLPQPNSYISLKKEISQLLIARREQAGRAVNTILAQTYWPIGRHIVKFEQGEEEKSEYETNLLNPLSKDLTLAFGKGFGRSNWVYIRKLYLALPICGTLSHNLGWSLYYEILKSEEPLEISFYTKPWEKENWFARGLKRQMKSTLFHRMAWSQDKE
ncbi:DUF1016 N-terminal domain-containing protein [Algoriphagus sp.]|uniref:DUF1016 N-terminal domain-containing protein n=1 Tax=Algoriphagus sp. TaxID=1872435 RepID=UPI002621F5EA|nr:DUF1016 N-terminal domain-containing protein [Algoriphagus sp.]